MDNSDENKTLRSAEYETLRQEMLDSYTREVNLVAFGFTATALIIGYGLTTFAQNQPNPLTNTLTPTQLNTLTNTLTLTQLNILLQDQYFNSLVFLVPLLILALILLQLNNSIYSILTISVYIRIFIEAKSKRMLIEDKSSGAYWETTISTLRQYLRHKTFVSRPKVSTNSTRKLYTLFSQRGSEAKIQWVIKRVIGWAKAHLHPVTLLTELWYGWAAALMGLTCAILAWIYDRPEQNRVTTIVVAGLWMIFCGTMLRRLHHANSGNYEKHMEDEIRKVLIGRRST